MDQGKSTTPHIKHLEDQVGAQFPVGVSKIQHLNPPFGFRIFGFGFWIGLVSVLYLAAPNGTVWILDFGF